MRKRFHDKNCSVARALDLLGEWWTMLIIREAFFGARHFDDFQKRLGIARNILSSRLRRLTEQGVLEQVPAKEGGRRKIYRLTDMGRELLPVLIALMQWGDRWITGPGREPLRVVERRSGRDIPRLALRGSDGDLLTLRDLLTLPGPGADEGARKDDESRAPSDTPLTEN